MKTKSLMSFFVDKESKKIKVEREFMAPLKQVWNAWTDHKVLDQWWAPKPWKSQTKMMDFKVGGYWLYAMVGPNGGKQWACANFKEVHPLKSFSLEDAFCDEDGHVDASMPKAYWVVSFDEKKDSTLVSIDIKVDKLADLEKLLEMGFQDGFDSGMGNLDELLLNSN